MKTFDLNAVRRRWVPALGWAIFLVLVIALVAGHYIFNPFVFGFGYYTVYVLSRLGVKEEKTDVALLSLRIVALGLIALLNLWTVLNNGIDKHTFLKQFDKTCARYAENTSANQVCDEIRSDIRDSLDKEPDFEQQ